MNPRVLFQDVKPVDVVASLDDLRGPATGPLVLPLEVYWGPEPLVDLASTSDVAKAYQAVLREGDTRAQAALLDRDLLVRTWPDLLLPDRVRAAWEARFPELTA
jgi:hypothetical protein